jgi:hypothetical protein
MKRENRDNSRKCNRSKICGNDYKMRAAAALSISLSPHAHKPFKDLTLLLASVRYLPDAACMMTWRDSSAWLARASAA